MTNLMQRGMAKLRRDIPGNAGTSITYSRSAASVTLTATVGATEYNEVLGDGSVALMQSRDYIVTASLLVLSSAVVEPARGDTITETVGGKTITCTVYPLNGDQCFRYSDHEKTILRVHTKVTSTT